MAPEEAYARRRVRRKEAFQHDRIMFHVPRTHCEEHGPRRKSGGHAMRARAPFSSSGHRCPFVPSLGGPETGVNCQLLVDVRGRTRPILGRANSRRRASVWSFASGFLSECKYSVQICKRTYKYRYRLTAPSALVSYRQLLRSNPSNFFYQIFENASPRRFEVIRLLNNTRMKV